MSDDTSAACDDKPPVASVVLAWCTRDIARALLPADHLLARAPSAARALVVERVREPDGGSSRDLYNACAVHGFLIGKDGGSATLAAGTIDSLHDVLRAANAPWLAAARAAVLEGYVTARLDAAGDEAKRRWEYPRCAVRFKKNAVALVAGFPDDDGEELAEWAARVARAAVADSVRRARIAGSQKATIALCDALALAGVTVSLADPSASASKNRVRSWLPWRRRDSR
jgi:hypothetical protein